MRIEIVGRFCYLEAAKCGGLDSPLFDGADVTLDVSGCTYVDAYGLQKLIALYKRARHVVITGADANFRAMLELTRLHQLFEIQEA